MHNHTWKTRKAADILKFVGTEDPYFREVGDNLSSLDEAFRERWETWKAAEMLARDITSQPIGNEDRVDIYDSNRTNQFGGLWCVAVMVPRARAHLVWEKYKESILWPS